MAIVLVSGCFDLLHAGHVCFLETAAQWGELYVSIGSDTTVRQLKRDTIYSENERLYMVRALKCVKHAFIAKGSGKLDFVEELKSLKPDIFLVNSDGHSEEKEILCRENGVTYVVLNRTPAKQLPCRSTTNVLKNINMPFRIDLAGGWLDQPWVSAFYPGPVITISIEPNYDFPDRTGMATSTRKRAIKLWGNDIPFGDREELARVLFCYDNCPGGRYISGSQDSIGIVFSGINRLNYDGKYWPESIETHLDESTISWLENNIKLIPMPPKSDDYDVLKDMDLKRLAVKQLAEEAELCWEAIMLKDAKRLGNHIVGSFFKQVDLFPTMLTPSVREALDKYQKKLYGMKVTGSGGFICAVTPEPIENEIKIRIRRSITPATRAGACST